MKKLILISLSILVVMALCFGVLVHVRLRQQQAIMDVVTQTNAARTQRREFRDGRILEVHPGNKLFSRPIYIGSLNKIVTVECPSRSNSLG
jgi:hypothetical protein